MPAVEASGCCVIGIHSFRVVNFCSEGSSAKRGTAKDLRPKIIENLSLIVPYLKRPLTAELMQSCLTRK